MTKLSELKQLYQEAAPGAWLATAGVVYAVLHDEESRIADCDFGCRDDVATARFIAHVHEAFPMLLDAVEALEIIAAGNTDPDRMVEIAQEILEKLDGVQQS